MHYGQLENREWPFKDGRFSTSSHFWNIWCFFERLFAQNYSNVNIESILTCFGEFKILAQIEYFAKAIAHAKAIAFARWLIFFALVTGPC